MCVGVVYELVDEAVVLTLSRKEDFAVEWTKRAKREDANVRCVR